MGKGGVEDAWTKLVFAVSQLVVVGQTVGFISSKTVAYAVYTHLHCARHR